MTKININASTGKGPASKARTTPPACLICFEDSATAGCSLIPLQNGKSGSSCEHCVCTVCFKHYLIQCENDRNVKPKCPDPRCEAHVPSEVMAKVLNRPYKAKEWNAEDGKAEKPDPELLAWLRQNEAQSCKNCKAWIIREEGCDAMQCLCGWRFCWECKAAVCAENSEGQCACGEVNYYDSGFHDNVVGGERYTLPELATAEDMADFATFCKRRKIEEGSHCDEEETYEEEAAGAFIGSIFDYNEPAPGVYETSCFECEEAVGCLLAPLFDALWFTDTPSLHRDEESTASDTSSMSFHSCLHLA